MSSHAAVAVDAVDVLASFEESEVRWAEITMRPTSAAAARPAAASAPGQRLWRRRTVSGSSAKSRGVPAASPMSSSNDRSASSSWGVFTARPFVNGLGHGAGGARQFSVTATAFWRSRQT